MILHLLFIKRIIRRYEIVAKTLFLCLDRGNYFQDILKKRRNVILVLYLNLYEFLEFGYNYSMLILTL